MDALSCKSSIDAAIFEAMLRQTPGRPYMRHFSRIIVAIAFFAAPAFAQPLADKVPANPIFYFGWRGSDDLGPAYADSHLKAILDQSNVRAIFNDMVPRAVARVGRANLDAGMAL